MISEAEDMGIFYYLLLYIIGLFYSKEKKLSGSLLSSKVYR